VSLDFEKKIKSELKNLWFQLFQELNAPFNFHERTGRDMQMPGQLFFSPLNDGYILIRTGILRRK